MLARVVPRRSRRRLNNTLVRRFAPKDSAALGPLWAASWNATLPEIDFFERLGWFDAWLTDHLAAGGAVLCAADDIEILGFVGVDPRIGWMEQLAVHPSAFGRGVGHALLDAAKALSPAGLALRVNQENPRAIAFYRRVGFVVTAEGVNPGGQRPVFDMAWRPDL